jgi:hypothetical protein
MLAPDGTELQRSFSVRSNMTKPKTCGVLGASYMRYSTLSQDQMLKDKKHNLRNMNSTCQEFCFQGHRHFRYRLGARKEKGQIKSMMKTS